MTAAQAQARKTSLGLSVGAMIFWRTSVIPTTIQGSKMVEGAVAQYAEACRTFGNQLPLPFCVTAHSVCLCVMILYTSVNLNTNSVVKKRFQELFS